MQEVLVVLQAGELGLGETLDIWVILDSWGCAPGWPRQCFWMVGAGRPGLCPWMAAGRGGAGAGPQRIFANSVFTILIIIIVFMYIYIYDTFFVIF